MAVVITTPARLGKLRVNAGRLAYVAPTAPHTPTPPHQSIAGPLSLQWLGDGNGFDVYFGTATNQPLVGTTRSRAWVLPPLTPGVVYYWTILAKANALGGSVFGPTWSFTAAAPAAPVYLAPPHHSTNQPTAVTLSWSQPQTVPGDISFDVYFGPTPSPLLVQRRQTGTTYTPALLRDGVDYYWRIVAVNNIGATSGPTWTFETRNPTKGLITIGGVDVRARVRMEGLAIRDLLADTPNTAAFTIEGSAPTVGQEVRIGLAALTGDDVIFGGYLDTVDALYEGRPEHRAWRVSAQDYTYGLNRRKVRTRYLQQSATAIALDLLAAWAPAGYTGTHIVAGLPIVTGGIDFTDEDVTTCFARLAARIGGYWYVDYAKDVHLFLTESGAAPSPITRAARVLLHDPSIHWATDLTQIRTRVYVEGGGSQARQRVTPGATSLPVTDASWYSPTGGLVVSGPQRIRYTGKGTVGGPTAPTATGQSIVGSLGAGPYSYVVTQVTAGAESPLSPPSAPVTLPAVAPPPTAMRVESASFSGVAPPTVVPIVTPTLSGVAPPTTAPTTAWATSIIPSPPTAPTASPFGTAVPAPPAAPAASVVSTQVANPAFGPSLTPIGTAVGAPGSSGSASGALPMTGELGVPPRPTSAVLVDGGTGTMHPGGTMQYWWSCTFTNARGETTRGDELQQGISAARCNVNVTVSPAPTGLGITGIKLYRRDDTNGGPRLVTTLGVNGGTFKDTVPFGSLGQTLPPSNTTGTPGTGALTPGTYYFRVTFVAATGETNAAAQSSGVVVGSGNTFTAAQLTQLPTSGDGRVTGRRIYRSAPGGGNFRLDATINDNTTTTYLSSKADSALGTGLSESNTTGTGKLVPGTTYGWGVTFVASTGETTGAFRTVTLGSTQDTVDLSGIPTSGDARVTQRRIYRTTANGSAYKLETTLTDNVTTTYRSGAVLDSALGAAPPSTNNTGTSKLGAGTYAWVVTFATSSTETTAGPSVSRAVGTGDVVNLSAIPTSPDGRVTRRKIYRTTAGGSAYRLEATIPDNTTTTYQSGSVADGSLGAAPPATNSTGTGHLVPGASYGWAVTFVTSNGETTNGPPLWPVALASTHDTANIANIPTSPDPRVLQRKLYRTVANGVGGVYRLETTIHDNTTTTYQSGSIPDASLGAGLPASNTSGSGGLVPGQSHIWAVTFVTSNGETQIGPTTQWNPTPAGVDQAQLSAIPIGSAQVVARRVYRSLWAGAAWGPFLFVTTINDNTTTAYLDAKPNAQLGDAAPTANDTGGGGLVPGLAYTWIYSFATASGETLTGGWTNWITMPPDCDVAVLSGIQCSNDPRVTRRKLYRYSSTSGGWQLEATINDNTTTTYTSTKTDGALTTPGLPPANTTGTGGLVGGGSYWWVVQFVTANGGYTTNSPGNTYIVPDGIDTVVLAGVAVSPDARVTKRRIYRTPAHQGIYKLEAEINDNTTTTYTSTKADAALGADIIAGNTTSAGGQIAVSAIAIGGGTTTARKLYRTDSGGAAYKLVVILNDNTTTTYQDNRSDASLGASAPLDEVTELIGIPASGPGAILYEIRLGDDVNIFVQCDDVAAQAALAALEGAPSQGIVEHVLQDRRLALSGATATGNADLALFARPIIAIQYATRDPNTRSGKSVHIDLPDLSLVGDFTIQTVEIDQIDIHPGLYPKYRVTCSSVRFSFEDAVRRFKLDVAGVE